MLPHGCALRILNPQPQGCRLFGAIIDAGDGEPEPVPGVDVAWLGPQGQVDRLVGSPGAAV